MAKKRVEIEALLRWAYRDELPKSQTPGRWTAPARGGWDAMAKFGDYLTMIDETALNRWGVVPTGDASGEPHPDALRVAGAVSALDALEVALPACWNPFADLGDFGALGEAAADEALRRLTEVAADGTRRLRSAPSLLVLRQAVLGGCPEWAAEKPQARPLRGPEGRPLWFVRRLITSAASDVPFEVELDGFDARARRPLPDAYQKIILDPSPVDAGASRGEYEIWRFALDVLVEELSGALEDHEPTPSTRARRPWESGVPRRVLRATTPQAWEIEAAQRLAGRRRRGRPKKSA